MDWRYPLRPFAPFASLKAGVSQRLLDHLLLDAPLAPGATILDANCGTGKLVRALSQLGFQATGTTTSPADHAAATRRSPRAGIRLLDDRLWSQFPAATYRLVIARDLLPSVGSRMVTPVFDRIAQLLRLVAPGGELVLVEQHGSERNGETHRRECALALLGSFGSATRLSVVRGRWWDGLGGFAASRRETVCTHLRVPAEPVSEDYWRQREHRLAAACQTPCCAGGAGTVAPTGERHSSNFRANRVETVRKAA
jgi:SAM-dependent methyltransferase